MSLVAQELLTTPQERSEAEKMENTEIKNAVQASPISDDVKVSGALVQTAQKTLSDLDRSIMELAVLVEGLRNQSKKLTMETV